MAKLSKITIKIDPWVWTRFVNKIERDYEAMGFDAGINVIIEQLEELMDSYSNDM